MCNPRPEKIGRAEHYVKEHGMIRKTFLKGTFAALFLGATAFATYVASADGPTPPAPAACGTSDTPCPLQKWMRANMGASLAAGDMDALGKALDHAAGLSPDATWTAWAQFAKQGSAAATAKDMNGVKASCKSCHDAFKDKYKAQYRTRPVS
jgi:cytochrome c556